MRAGRGKKKYLGTVAAFSHFLFTCSETQFHSIPNWKIKLTFMEKVVFIYEKNTHLSGIQQIFKYFIPCEKCSNANTVSEVPKCNEADF